MTMKAAGAVLVLVWLVSLPLLSFVRAQDWTNEYALWRGAQRWSPAKLRPTVELGRMEMLAGHPAAAEQQFRHALELWERGRPAFEQVGCVVAAENLVRVLQQQGKFAEAVMWSEYSCAGPR